MTGEAYFIALADDRTVARIEPAIIARGLSAVFSSFGVAVYATSEAPRSELATNAIILGTVFGRGFRPIDRTNEMMLRRAATTNGGSLLQDYWGTYLAVIVDSSSEAVSVLRDPAGGMPCYHTTTADGTFLSSTPDFLFGSSVISASIDWANLGLFISTHQLRGSRTCLTGVHELLAGTQLISDRQGCRVTERWSPWQFVDRSSFISDPTVAAELLHWTVVGAIGAQASLYSKILLSLSGGLDSSIVAAALAHSGADMTCLTIATDQPSGDERRHARDMAAFLGVELIEAFESDTLVDLSKCDRPDLPRPVSRGFAQSHDRIAACAAETVGADGHFMGGGGDNVFCYLQSASPLADQFIVEGPSMRLWQTAQAIGTIADCAAATVIARAFKRIRRRPRGYIWPVDRSFLTPGGPGMDEEPGHPWLNFPDNGLPGKASHIAWLLTIQNHLEGFSREALMSVVSPLMSQPVVELCLRIPTWLWCANGRNRAVARDAFSNWLPDTVLKRSTKGTPDSFVADLYNKRRDMLRDFLLEGVLTANGLLDREKVEQAFADRRPATGNGYHRLMRLADAEAWARHWV